MSSANSQKLPIMHPPLINHKTKKLGKKHFFQSYLNNIEQNNQIKKQSQAKLPGIYLNNNSKQGDYISLSDNYKVLKQLSTKINFVNNKISVINDSILTLLNQETKSIPYQHSIYQQELVHLNSIFNCSGINLKSKDILICEGQSSNTKYIFFTNYPKHPFSICCNSPILIKHINFISGQFFANYLKKDKSRQKNLQPLKNLILLTCLNCSKNIIRIKVQQLEDDKLITNRQRNSQTQYQQKKRLLNFSKLISSGRFRRNLINDESVTLMESRSIILDRSKSKIMESSVINENKQSRYDQTDKFSNLKGQQFSLNLLDRLKRSQKLRNIQTDKPSPKSKTSAKNTIQQPSRLDSIVKFKQNLNKISALSFYENKI